MFAIVKNNQIARIIRPHVGFNYDGVEYSANWLTRLSAERKADLGIVPVATAPSPDQRFYWVTANNPQMIDGVVKIMHTATPKNLNNLKVQWTAQVKDSANKMLASTDWYVVRKIERDVAVPDDIQSFRSDVVAECARLEAAIDACEDVEALIEAVQVQQWPSLEQPAMEADPVIEEPVQEQAQEQLQEEIVIDVGGNNEEVVVSGNTAAMDLSDNDESVVISGNSEGV